MPLSSLNNLKWQHMLTLVNKNLNPAQRTRKLYVSRFISENIFVLLLQYIGLIFSTLAAHPCPLWFASGTACALIFLRGYSVLPGIWLGSFLAYALAKTGFAVSIGCATLFSLQAFLLLWLSYRYIVPTLLFSSRKKFLQFVLLSALASAMITAGLIILYRPFLYDINLEAKLGLHWWLANLNGILILGCGLIAFDAYFPEIKKLKRQPLLLLLYAMLFLLVMVICISTHFNLTLTAGLLSLPCIFLLANLGWPYGITAIFLVGITLNFAAYLNAPILNHSSFTLIELQFFLLLETIIALHSSLNLKYIESHCVRETQNF